MARKMKSYNLLDSTIEDIHMLKEEKRLPSATAVIEHLVNNEAYKVEKELRFYGYVTVQVKGIDGVWRDRKSYWAMNQAPSEVLRYVLDKGLENRPKKREDIRAVKAGDRYDIYLGGRIQEMSRDEERVVGYIDSEPCVWDADYPLVDVKDHGAEYGHIRYKDEGDTVELNGVVWTVGEFKVWTDEL